MTTTTTNTWFTVDKKGLGDIASRRGAAWWLYELMQNTWDEPGATECEISIRALPEERGWIRVTVTDDAPNGFHDLTHAYTMFATSKKADNPELRGRFNIGEKLFLSICGEASIVSTTGSINFHEDGSRTKGKNRTTVGTIVAAKVRCNQPDLLTALADIREVIPPADVKTWVVVDWGNGGEREVTDLSRPEPLASVEGVRLPTEFTNDEGEMRRTTRQTSITIFEAEEGQGSILEMGIPICDIDSPYRIDIGQAVPLSIERDSVTPAYLEKVHVATLNAIHGLLTPAEAAAPWVATALPGAEPEAVVSTVETRFGKGAVVYDPSDPEANKAAMNAGRTVIPSATFRSDAWSNIKKARETNPKFAQPAGREFQSGIPTSLDGVPPISESDWTPEMHRFAEYAQAMAKHMLVPDPMVLFERLPKARHVARWDNGVLQPTLTVNVAHFNLARRSELDVDQLLIHEFAHNRVKDHLTIQFSDEVGRLGAYLRNFEPRWEDTV